MQTIVLPSGVELQIAPAPFADAKDLYQAFLVELKHLQMDGTQSIDHNFIKNLFCIGFSSKKIEDKIWKCMSRCLYDKLKITQDTFESEASRSDYFDVLFEVAKVNIMPFTKNLYAKFASITGTIASSQK